DDVRPLAALGAVFVVVDDAVRHAVRAHGDLAHAAARREPHAVAHRDRPVRDVRARLGALRATEQTRARVDAGGAALVLDGRDGAVGWPPVPPELVEALGQRLAELAERDRWQR